MEKLAIFDIDFTLTSRETLLEFYKFMIRNRPKLLRKVPYSLYAGVLYILKRTDLKAAKSAFLSLIDEIEETDLNLLIKDFYKNVISNILYKDSIEMIKKLKAEGYKIILISASSEFYLNEFYNIKEVDKVIGTIYEFGKDKKRGKIIGENCKGEEKVKRLMEYIKTEKVEVDFTESYMFSDSMSDAPLFRLVGHPYLINFKGKNAEYEILKWK